MIILPETGNSDLICQVVNINRWLSTTLADVAGWIPLYLFSVEISNASFGCKVNRRASSKCLTESN